MRYLLFVKEFIHKKTTKNYILIIFSIAFIISIVSSFYIFSGNVINRNYKKSYYVMILDTKDKYNAIKNYKNTNQLLRCTFDGNIVIVENKNNILIPNNENVKVVSEKEFNTYEYNDGYYVTLKNWINFNEKNDYFINKNIDYEIFLNRTGDSKIEDYYNYFFYMLILIIIVASIIFIITIINIIIDEQKYNNLYYCLGYNGKRIFLICLIKIFSMVMGIAIINGIIQFIIECLINITHYYNLVIHISLLVATLLITICMIIGRNNKIG